MITYIVEGPDNFQKRIYRTPPDALIIMRQKLDKFESTWFDVGQKMDLCGSKESAHGVGRYLLLNRDGTIDFQECIEFGNFVNTCKISRGNVGDRHTCILMKRENEK